jgi:hypothetical protein
MLSKYLHFLYVSSQVNGTKNRHLMSVHDYICCTCICIISFLFLKAIKHKSVHIYICVYISKKWGWFDKKIFAFILNPKKIYNFMHTTQFYQQNSKGINVLIRTKTPLTWISLKMFNILTVMLPQILLIKLVNNSLVRIGETSVVWLLSIKQ